jgi:hypothetical protein
VKLETFKFHQSSQLAPKFSTCAKVLNLHQSSQLAPKFSTCTKILNLHQSSQLAPKFSTCTKVLNLHQSSQLWNRFENRPEASAVSQISRVKKKCSREEKTMLIKSVTIPKVGSILHLQCEYLIRTQVPTWWTDWGIFRPFGIVYFG